MADIQVESDAQDTSNTAMQPRNLVWTSPTTGYVFFIESGQDLHYRKTIDSGASWSTEATVRTASIISFSVWYDKWTPGDTGDLIHIAYVEANADDMMYDSLDTSDDSLGGPVVVFNGSSAAFGDWNDKCITVSKSRAGGIFVSGWIDAAGEHDTAKGNADPPTSFASINDVADGSAVDMIQLLPDCNSADPEDMWCIYHDASNNGITLKVYDDSGNSWSESTAFDSLDESSGYFVFDSMIRHSDGHAIVVAWNNSQSITGDLVAWDITNITTWSQLTNIVENDSVYGTCGLMINQQNDDLYVVYSDGGTTGNILYALSENDGSTWSAGNSMSATADDHRAFLGGTSVGDEGGRWQPIWFNDDLNDLMTNTDNAINIPVAVAVTGSQINIGDSWSEITGMQVNIGDAWKAVASANINIGDAWKAITI